MRPPDLVWTLLVIILVLLLVLLIWGSPSTWDSAIVPL
jgi:hypothetical protein